LKLVKNKMQVPATVNYMSFFKFHYYTFILFIRILRQKFKKDDW